MTATTSTTMSANRETFFFSLFSGVFCARRLGLVFGHGNFLLALSVESQAVNKCRLVYYSQMRMRKQIAQVNWGIGSLLCLPKELPCGVHLRLKG